MDSIFESFQFPAKMASILIIKFRKRARFNIKFSYHFHDQIKSNPVADPYHDCCWAEFFYVVLLLAASLLSSLATYYSAL